MARYIRYDWINEQVIDHYETSEDIIKCANEFYHDTFQCEENYDENKDIKTIEEAVELFEGSGYEIYIELISIINAVKGVSNNE